MDVDIILVYVVIKNFIYSHGILRGFICEPTLNDFQQPKDVVADATGGIRRIMR